MISAIKDPDDSVRKQVIITLGKIGDIKALNALIGSLKDQNADVRKQAIIAVGNIGDITSLDELINSLSDDVQENRFAVAYAISQLKGSRKDKFLIDSLNNKNHVIIAGACEYYINNFKKGSEETLIETLKLYPSPGRVGLYLDRGNKKLEAAARDVADRENYKIYLVPDYRKR